jgi:DNA polymerase-1
MTKGEKKRLVLFDAHAIIHRAYHALPDFSTKAGESTGGLYGLTTMLIKAITDLKPDYLAACYDLPGPTFRHKEYAAYKAGRAKADEALVSQLIRSRDVFSSFGIPIYDSPGFEADDMLGTIVEQMKKRDDIEIVIVTGDMDSLQLVRGNDVRVFTLKKGLNDTILYDEEKVRERFGFGPELLVDYKGLRGDPSDNIIGIPGIGEKTATELITKFGGIDSIYEKLKQSPETVEKEGVRARIVGLLREHEDEARFSRVLATIRRDAPITYRLPERTWRDALDVSSAKTLMKELEFRSLGERIEKVFGETPVAGSGSEIVAPKEPPSPVPEDELKKISLALWIVDSDRTNASLEDILEYAGTTDFAEAKRSILSRLSEGRMKFVYEEIELPLIPLIQKMQERGIRVDTPFLERMSEEYHQLQDAVLREIYKDSGEEFNVNSPKQMAEVLFDRMKLSVKGLKKTEGGARSTRESELEKLREVHPIIGKILKYRELQKLLSTYIDTIPKMVAADGRLHTTFHQGGTTTGRMSSSNPNLQNIPTRDGLGERMRDAFISDNGHTLLAFDYSQIEMRVLAMLSGDPGLIEIFREGQDVHTSVAARVFRVSPADVTREMRRRAKVINFGIIYGMGVNALRQNLGSGRDEAQEFYDQYFITFPNIAAYFESLKKTASKQGYTETLFGRRRQFADIRSKIPYIRAAAERMVMNAPIQGTAADIVKLAMLRANDMLTKAGLLEKAQLILQVHDELIFEVRDDPKTIARVAETVRIAMEGVGAGDLPHNTPLEVDAKSGKRWGSMERYTERND